MKLTPTVGHASELLYRCDRVCTGLPTAAISGYKLITRVDGESDRRTDVAEFDLALVEGGHR